MKTFPIGGIHPSDNKISGGAKIKKADLPKVATIALAQAIGAPATAIVEKGDRVVTGQLIAQRAGFVSANVHSSVTGKVTAIEDVIGANGIRQMSIVIAVEADEWAEGIDTTERIVRECGLSPQEIVTKITDAGIVGMGGATFPTHVKLSVPEGKKAEWLVINGVECEPYLTADHRLMLERGEELLVGVRILAKALGAEKIAIGIEANKPDAIEALTKLGAIVAPEVKIVPLKVQYPQGGEKQLIAAITERQVPSGGLPIDVGVVVQNVATALAVYEAVQKGKPLIERIVTITGKSVKNPSNLLVRIGTPISELIDACGGVPEGTGKIISGGPMMGRAISNVAAPVTKGTSGIVLLDQKEARRFTETDCIRCGRCVSACPMGIEPYLLSTLSKKSIWEEAERHNITDCIECGSCSYSCPASSPLLDYIRLGKTEVMKIIRSRR